MNRDLKKQLFTLNVNPRTILTIMIWLFTAWFLSRPLQSIGQVTYKLLGVGIHNAFHGISRIRSNTEELLKAKTLVKKQLNKISLLETKINYLENEVQHHDNFRKLLNFKKDLNYKTIGVSVIGRSADNWHKQIILDKGANHNVRLGDSILSTDGVIGQVVSVNNDTSTVQLISDPSYKLGCKIARSNILGILTGKSNSIGLINFIPIGSDVKPGDLVVTSGIRAGKLPPIYPPNHPIGRVVKVSKEKSQASDLYIEVKLSENLNSLSDVLVFSPD